MTIHAIYENGVFRPIDPVSIPDHSLVILHAVIDEKALNDEMQDNAAIWSALSKSLDAGDRFLAQRHDEHQP